MADHPGRVLVVDDNKVNRLLLARTLELQGHHVESAANGRLALARLNDEDFDLVLLDIEMPELDGFEVLAQLKEDRRPPRHPRHRHVVARGSRQCR